MSVFHENMLIGSSGQGAPAAAGISRSLRFNSSDSAFCSRVFSSAGNRTTWTWSGWVKRCNLAAQQTIFDGFVDGGNRTQLMFESDNTFRVLNQVSSSVTTNLITTPVYRDASAWYHVLVAWDTSQGTSSNRVKIYFNGSQVTAFATSTYPGSSENSFIDGANTHSIGRTGAFAEAYLSAYLADIHFISGQALTPSSFTEVSATTGQLIPKAYTGSYGTNGFKLDFADNSAATAAALGKDSSGNSPANNWTPTNFSVLDGRTSVAAATGALPIYNTTDTYGAALGSGVRSDSFASSLVLAAPLTTQGGGSLTNDVSPSGRTSSTKTLTNTNVTSSTSVSKYYGGSAVFSSSSSSAIDIAASSDFQFGSGDFTVEFWIYPTNTTGQNVLGYGNSSGGTGFALIKTASQFQGQFAMSDGTKVFTGGSYTVNTWNHVAAVRSGSTITLYVNGTSSATASTSGSVTTGTDGFAIGRYGLYGGSCDAQFQDVRVYKGVAKYTSNFTPPTSVQNVTTAAGNDSLVDTPTSYGTDTGAGGEVRGNYCTWNALAKGSDCTLSNGNLDVAWGSAGSTTQGSATIGMSSGKWYWETTITASSASPTNAVLGITTKPFNDSEYPGYSATSWGYRGSDGQKWTNTSGSSYGASYANGDVVGVAFDADNGTLTFYKNGSSQGTAFTGLTSGPYFPAIGDQSSSQTFSAASNFGQRPFAYAAPSGFKALCDTNLPAPVVAKPNTVMDVKLYTGNGSTQTISGLGFGPDLVWVKSRNNASWWHVLTDAVRGGGYFLHSNNTNAEGGGGTSLITGFTSDGFSLNNSPNGTVNALNDTYVAWTWDAGSSTVTNTQGSITSSVRANATAGFSIIGYTGTGSNATVGHGLGVTPGLLICKSRTQSGGSNWVVWHSLFTGSEFLRLNTTDSKQTASVVFNSTAPSSTVISLGTDAATNGNGNTHIIYAFAPVVGYSSFGSYTGNGSADGPFVYTGFRPRWIMFKNASVSGENWWVHDTARNTYNVMTSLLLPDSSSAEVTSTAHSVDALSNGFKVRTNAQGINGVHTIVYACFAESPFQYARAR